MSYSLQILTASARSRMVSDEVLGGSLCQRWHEVNPRVQLRRLHCNQGEIAPADVTLLHTTFDAVCYRPEVLAEIRDKSRVLVGWMEILPCEERLRFFDLFFYFANPLGKPSSQLMHLPPPYEPSDYPQRPPIGGRRRILLDHSTTCYPCWHHPEWDWTTGVQAALRPLVDEGWTIGQLNRGPADPDWLEHVEQCEVREYLRRMAEYDTFVVTHAGSFNHSAKDARLMGLQVIVPIRDNTPFVPDTIAGRLGMQRVVTEEQLVAAVRNPGRVTTALANCITIRETAERMDREIRFLLSARS